MSFGLPLLEASRDRGTGNLPDDLRVILLVGTRQRTEERGARCGADATHHEGRAYPASNIAPCVYPKPPRVRTTFRAGRYERALEGIILDKKVGQSESSFARRRRPALRGERPLHLPILQVRVKEAPRERESHAEERRRARIRVEEHVPPAEHQHRLEVPHHLVTHRARLAN